MATTSNHEGLRGQALAEAVVAVVEQRPDLHDQSDVACGTTGCLAGWTIAIARGVQPGQTLGDAVYDPDFRDDILEIRETWERRDTPLVAMRLLGIDEDRRADFINRVFSQQRREDAIEAFIDMTGIADVPDALEADEVDVQDVIDDRKWEAFHEAGGHR